MSRGDPATHQGLPPPGSRPHRTAPDGAVADRRLRHVVPAGGLSAGGPPDDAPAGGRGTSR